MFNVPSDKFIEVKNPYAPKEILQNFDGKTTAYIAAVGEKDESRLTGKYFKPYKGKTGYGYSEIGYTYAVPAESNPISGTDVRSWLGSGDDESKKKAFLKAYPKFNVDIFKMITNKLNEDGFPGGIGTGLDLPGGYINGAPTGSTNESNNTHPSSEFRKEPHPTRHETEHPSDEPDWYKTENLYDPIGNVIDRVVAEEIFKEFSKQYFGEAPNPIMDKEFDYTASNGTKKKITVKGALRLPKEHPAHVQASKLVGSDKTSAMAKGPKDAPANEPKKLPQQGKAAKQAAKPAQPGQPVKQGQTQQGKADKATAKSTTSTPQGAEQTPPPQTLSGDELKSSAEKKKDTNKSVFGKWGDRFKQEVKEIGDTIKTFLDEDEAHIAHEGHDPNSPIRKKITEKLTDFVAKMPANVAKHVLKVAKQKVHQLKNTGRGIQSLAVSAMKGEKPKFGMYKNRDGKWQHSENEAKRQKKAFIDTGKDIALTAAAVITAGAISGAVAGAAHGIGGIAHGAAHGATHTLSHGVSGFLHHMAVDFGKHCFKESVFLATGAGHTQAANLAMGAGLIGENIWKNTINEEDDIKQNASMYTELLKQTLEKMETFEPNPTQYLEMLKSYAATKQKADLQKLVGPMNEVISPLKRENVNHFVEYATKRLKLKEQPKVTLVEDPEFSKQNHSLGGYNVESKEIFVATEGRLTADILRTIAHEMIHRKQDEMGLIGDSVKDGADGSPIENKANSVAAILLREYGKLNKTIYNEDINIDVDKGDTVLMGKFKNKKVVAKDFGTDDHGMPTINGKVATTFRIPRGEEKPNSQSVFDEVTTNDWHFKAVMALYNKSNSFGKKKIAAAVCSNPNASKRDIEIQLRDTDYEEVTNITDKLRLSEYIQKKKLSEIEAKTKGLGGTNPNDYETNAEKDFNKHHSIDMYTNSLGTLDKDTIDFDDEDTDVGFVPYDSKKDKIKRGYEPVKTEKLTQSNLDSVERYADRELDPADIEFSNHFFDRVNDTRNGKEISEPELTGFFKRLGRHKKQFIDFLDKYNQIVVKDDRSNINIPFVKMANKVIAKTIMRKNDFQTNSPTIVNEITQGLYAGNLKIGGKSVEIEVELLGADNKTKEFLTKIIHIDKEYQNKLPISSTFRIPARIFRLPGGGWHKIKSSAFNEEVTNGKVICDNCGWSWNLSDGYDGGETNPYLCHKCGHNNQPKLNEGLLLEGGAYVICNECGERMKQIQYRHLMYKHNMTMNEYKEKHPNSKLVCEDVKNVGDKNPMKTDIIKLKHKNSVNTIEYKDKISKALLGKNIGNIRNDLSERNKTSENKLKVSNTLKETYKNNKNLRDSKSTIGKQFGFGNKLLIEKLYTKLGWTRPEDREPFALYQEIVRRNSDKNYQKYFNEIPNAKNRSREYHLDHKYSIKEAFDNNIPIDVVSHYKNLEIIDGRLNESKGKNSSILLEELLKQIEYSIRPLNMKILLQCGGAYGHMAHPFDDMNLTFGDLKNIITGALTGKLELTREKTDGQALAISWKNGRLIAARNKGNLANAGANAMGIEDVASKFAGRGGLTDAYNFAMKDLSAAIQSLSEPQRKKIFNEGQCFMNLEVIWPTSVNVIPYGRPLLVFHNTTCYDEKGVAIGANQGAATMLAGMIKQVNGDVQSKYIIQGPPVTKLPNNEELSSKQSKYLTQLQKLQFQFQLSNKDGVADYHRAWWANFIDKSKVKLQKLERDALINRWAFGDKSFRLNTITDKDAQKWAMDNDKVNVANQQKENIRPFEEIFLGVGADVLSFMDSVLTANPNAAVANMKQRLKDTADKVRGSGDVSKIEKLKKELARLQSIGGLDKIVPNEGIVFIYKGNTYKLTGTFAPLNQILGIFYE